MDAHEEKNSKAAVWAERAEALIGLSDAFYGEDGEEFEGFDEERAALRVLFDRCRLEAEKREPGIMRRRLD